MASGKVYFYKEFPYHFQQREFGDYQANFNFNLVLDETKDSCKIVVLSMEDTILEPNTIVKLEHIDNWWCVKKDTRNRLMNDSGYLYQHTLELQGAFEILNSRDLINCGFNTNHYFVYDFLDRLVSLSNYELPITFDYGNVLSNKVVDYLKTFENYTLASAIKEFLNGYNCLPKMSFVLNGNNTIVSATIKIYSKSGLTDTPLSEDVFNETSAVDNIDRESYANKVISNIQNCVGREPTRYPKVGGAYLVGENGYITYDNAQSGQSKFFLPSNAYSVESITIYAVLKIGISTGGYVYLMPDDMSRKGLICKAEIIQRLTDDNASQDLIDFINNNWQSIFDVLKRYGSRTIINGGYYDAIEEQPHGDFIYIGNNRVDNHNCRLYLNNERYAYNSDGDFEWVISWKQGSNEIKGLGEAIAHAQKKGSLYSSSWFLNENNIVIIESEGTEILYLGENAASLSLLDETSSSPNFPHCLISVNYIPMHDIKFKTDNNIVGNNAKLYNQNGKLVDSYAVSKLVNSYCKSIRDKDLVRFGTYYKFSEIPKVGARVGDYVINNISYDVYDNDNGGFVYKCQFALNLYSICKSTMINANTNIRDYDCPQSNNVKRIQTYRDYVEISYDVGVNDATYLDTDKILHIGLDYLGVNDNLVFVMKANDDSFDNQEDDHSYNYYYHLNHISFDLSKQKKIIVDFGDNNIIGYGNAHAYKPFTLGNIFNSSKAVTIPISYVNNYGELKGITLLATDDFDAEYNFGGVYISESVAIKPSIYNNFEDNYLLKINEPLYKKDGLEIPVFEYSCEIGGDGNIEVADNFFECEENFDKFVAVKFDFPINNENASMRNLGTSIDVILYFNGQELDIITPSGRPQSAKGHWGIYAKKDSNYRFLFALNNYQRDYEDGDTIYCFFNFYKLK